MSSFSISISRTDFQRSAKRSKTEDAFFHSCGERDFSLITSSRTFCIATLSTATRSSPDFSSFCNDLSVETSVSKLDDALAMLSTFLSKLFSSYSSEEENLKSSLIALVANAREGSTIPPLKPSSNSFKPRVSSAAASLSGFVASAYPEYCGVSKVSDQCLAASESTFTSWYAFSNAPASEKVSFEDAFKEPSRDFKVASSLSGSANPPFSCEKR